jgi:hypothetical protein
MSGGTWGSIDGLLLAWAARDLRSDPEASYDGWWGGTILGGLVGIGGGIGYSYFRPSPGDVAAVNSLTGYGLLGGFLVGGIMDPPYGGAYGLNAAIGSAVGIAGGLYLASEVEVSRQRMALIDLGALLGAGAPWLLVYPVITEDSSNGEAETNDDEQVTSFLSLVTMGVGIGVTWWWTRDFDARRRGDLAEGPTSPALLSRSESGRWSLGMPALRLSPPSTPERTVTVDLLGGSW